MTDPLTYYAAVGGWIRAQASADGPYRAYVIYQITHQTLGRYHSVVPAPKWPLGQRAWAMGIDHCDRRIVRLYGVWWDGVNLRYNWLRSDDGGRATLDLGEVIIIC